MPANTLPIVPGAIKTAKQTLVPADTTTTKVLVTAGANGSRIDAISLASNDTAAKVVDLFVYDGATDYPIGAVSVPIGAGTDGGTTPVVSALTQANLPWLDSSGSIFLAYGWSLKIGAHATVTTAKQISAIAFYGDY